jgi:hypothetical protein
MLEIRVCFRNSMTEFASAKDYDLTLALEYERSETDFARFVYVTSSDEVLRFVSLQFRNSKGYVCSGLPVDWYRRLLDREVFDWKCHQYRPFRAA